MMLSLADPALCKCIQYRRRSARRSSGSTCRNLTSIRSGFSGPVGREAIREEVIRLLQIFVLNLD